MWKFAKLYLLIFVLFMLLLLYLEQNKLNFFITHAKCRCVLEIKILVYLRKKLFILVRSAHSNVINNVLEMMHIDSTKNLFFNG